jgi:pectate lyase
MKVMGSPVEKKSSFYFPSKALSASILFFVLSLSAFSITRPTFSDTPFGFANVGGTFAIPACGSTPTYYVTTDAEMTAYLGSNRILIVAAGQYSSVAINNLSNLSIIGENGTDIKNMSIKGSSTQNILIRNISITRYPTDGLSITGGKNIWIDHCTIGYLVTAPTRDTPDGAMDITGGPDYITVSWCWLRNAWKFGLLGSSDSDSSDRHFTSYCNYIYNTFQRTPRIRYGHTHVINCLYENNGWCRPTSITSNEFTYQETAGYADDGEYLKNHRVVSIGYGIMATCNSNVVVDSCFFYDVRWPIVASRDKASFMTIYGDLQSPDINNKTPTALKQTGNAYDDSGLLAIMRVKTDTVSSTLCSTEVDSLGYQYAPGRYIINPTALNPSKKSIKFDEYNPGGAFSPASYAGYYPSGFTAMTAQEVRTIIPQYAGADKVQFCPTGAAPTLTTPTNKDQTEVTTISNIVFAWGGGAVDVKVFNLPAGLTITRDTTNKTLTISGSPTASGTYTIMTEGGTGSSVSISGSIAVKSAINCVSTVKIAINNLSTSGKYKLVLFDTSGTTEIQTLANGSFVTGDTEFSFIPGSLSSGNYTYKLLSDATVVKSGTVSIP